MKICLLLSTVLVWVTMAFAPTNAGALPSKKCIMYLTGQHNVVPHRDLLSEVTHVALAFMRSGTFNADESPSEWPLFTTVEKARSQFLPGTKIMVAIGGWGDTAGFEEAAATVDSRERWARNVAAMVQMTGADGQLTRVGTGKDCRFSDLPREGRTALQVLISTGNTLGNGEDYKTVPNSEKEWQIEAYPLLLGALRWALGPSKLISAAVPGLPRDLIAFTASTTPRIAHHLDFLNVMTYDLMNRRDNVTKHHTGVANSLTAIDAYLERGVAADKLNLGFAFYAKWFRTGRCPDPENTVGCPTLLLEDPVTGADLGRTGGFSWHDPVPAAEAASFARALSEGKYDEREGGYYYWDEEERIWWTFDTPHAILRKFPLIVEEKGLGGVFAWGLGEDAPKFEHLRAVNEGLRTETERTKGVKETVRINDEL